MIDLTIVDDSVNEKLKALRKVIIAHERLDEQLEEVPPFFPDEILANVENVEFIERLWKNKQYDMIKREYAEIWIDYYSYVYDDETDFTVDDFLQGTVNILLNS